MTQLPPEPRSARDHSNDEWQALLSGELPRPAATPPAAGTPSTAERPAAAETPSAAQTPAPSPSGEEPSAFPAPASDGRDAGAPPRRGRAPEPDRAMTRRERREAEQRRFAEEEAVRLIAEADVTSELQHEPAARPVPASRAGAADRSDRTSALPPEHGAGVRTAEMELADLVAARPAAAEAPERHRPTRAERRAASAAGIDDGYPETHRRRRGPWGCLVALIIVIALAAGAFFFLQGPITALIDRFTPAEDYTGQGTGEVLFQVEEGDNGTTIATKLVDRGVVASEEAFLEAIDEAATEPTFYPGVFRLAEQMSASAALEALLDEGNKLENTFLVTEGMALPDVLVAAADGTGVPLDQLQAAAAEAPSSYGLPAEATTLEGFLFPATYELEPDIDARGVLQTMVDRQFEALDAAGVPVEQRWQTIVLASIVQREAGSNADDFPKVARVFLNRLDQGMHLQSDATVAYGTGNTHTVWTTDAERADASNPYNTYANPGLPAGPIGNPGDVAINAAIHPADGTWLFFVPVNLATGETVFSTTVDEHDAAVARLQAWCQESAENAAYCE